MFVFVFSPLFFYVSFIRKQSLLIHVRGKKPNSLKEEEVYADLMLVSSRVCNSESPPNPRIGFTTKKEEDTTYTHIRLFSFSHYTCVVVKMSFLPVFQKCLSKRVLTGYPPFPPEIFPFCSRFHLRDMPDKVAFWGKRERLSNLTSTADFCQLSPRLAVVVSSKQNGSRTTRKVASMGNLL